MMHRRMTRPNKGLRMLLGVALATLSAVACADPQWQNAPQGTWGTPSNAPLSVEQAFATDLTALSDGTVRLAVRPAPGYQVAPEHVSIRSQTDGVTLGKTTTAGQNQDVWLLFPVQRTPTSSGRLTLAVTFQGCQGPGGVCYPPTTRTISTLLPPATVPAARVVEGAKALEAALAEPHHKPVVVELYADWCGPCRKFEASLAPSALQQALQKVTWIRVDLSANAPEDVAWMNTHGALGLPALWVLRHGQQPNAKTVHLGAWSPDALAQILQPSLR